MDQETESRLSPDLPSPPAGPADDPTAAPRSQDSTSSGKKTQAPRTKLGSGEYRRRGKGQLTNLQSKKQVKDPVSSKETLPPQTASQVRTTNSAFHQCFYLGNMVKENGETYELINIGLKGLEIRQNVELKVITGKSFVW